MKSRISSRLYLALSALALLWPLAATAEGTAQATASAKLSCKLGAGAIISNNGSATLPAGTRIVVRFYVAPGAVGQAKQETFSLKSDLAPGGDVSFAGESLGYYGDCSARAAS